MALLDSRLRDDPNATTQGTSKTDVEDAPESRLVLSFVFPRYDGPVLDLSGDGPREAVIGRHDSCELVLAGGAVSRRHARISRNAAYISISDMGSRNGIYVNGAPVSDALLKAGDVLRIGDWVGLVRPAGRFEPVAPGLYGGPRLLAALAPARTAARSSLPMVLEGETGTGKEVVCRAVHGWSGRTGACVPVNCAALPESLAEAELFGYRKGAFTGAHQANLGLIRNAEGGTLFLDEICELPLVLQAKLLRFLEVQEVQPIGESRPVKVDVRVVAAAQEPLAQAVAAGRFRADLFARLEALTVQLPPLRARREDVPYLFTRLLLDKAGERPPRVEAKLIERLCLYDWPFNVRELARLVEFLVVLHGSSEGGLKLSHLPARMLPAGTLPSRAPSEERSPVEAEEVGVDELAAALRSNAGNVKRAAAMLGISRQRAYRLLKQEPAIELDELRKSGDCEST